MRTNNSVLAPDVYEVVLQINLEARSGDKVVWLCELQQAAAFVVKNLPSTDLMQVLNLMAPNYLLTYARATISDLVVKGGFPPFLLPLVTFEALHARQRAQQQTAEGAATVN
jgi:preprotein translocase subunit SecB